MARRNTKSSSRKKAPREKASTGSGVPKSKSAKAKTSRKSGGSTKAKSSAKTAKKKSTFGKKRSAPSKSTKRAKKASSRKADTPDEPTLFDAVNDQPSAETPPELEPTKRPVPAGKGKRPRTPPRYASAEAMAKTQRNISVSEFFAKNRHLLGFDNPRKALLTTVKEAVDNALDACEEAGILPKITVRIEQLDETHFRVTVGDNGPGIVKQQIPNIFGKLLYGSKFHRLRMSRGQQGIGISAAGMYGLLTTGRPVVVTSRTSKRSSAHHYELKIDTQKNRPDIIRDEVVEWEAEHGTEVAIELEARYQKGKQSVDGYLEQTAIANPHVAFTYHSPDGRTEEYPAAIQELPAIPKEIKPHPHGVELGVLIKMIQDTKARSLQQFFTSEFSRISAKVAQDIITHAAKKDALAGETLTPKTYPSRVTAEMVKALYQAIQEVKILTPSTNCIVPIGEEQLIKGLQHVVGADFYTAVTRRPAVYRGNPFVIEASLAYGKPETREEKAERIEEEVEAELAGDDNGEDQSLARLMRFANRVPLQYQQGACAITKAVVGMNWRSYGLQQGRGALPGGDLVIVVHMGSVWVPFTSESKEAVAGYPEILKELRLALQECGRRLGSHIRKAHRIRQELKKRSYIERYIPAIGEALRDILDLKEKQVEGVCDNLKDVLERSRKM
jgi:DNA topoisomerase VI subunit B